MTQVALYFLLLCTIDVYKESNTEQTEPSPTLLVALMQPSGRSGGAEELEKWYIDEHNQQMSEQKGWVRSKRYRLQSQHDSAASAQKQQELSFLAIHEFREPHDLGIEVKAVEPVSEWTIKIMGEAEAIDAAIYNKVGKLGM